jgi:tetratricopeptide (TPR) repeat protein
MNRFVSLMCFVAVLASTPVWAQDEGSDVDKIQEHFEKGVALYFEQKYDEAIQEFQKGYALYPDPIFLYNISTSHGKMGRMDQSLAVAELADSTGIAEPDATQNRARMAALRQYRGAAEIANDLALAKRQNAAVVPAPTHAPSNWLERRDWRFWTGAGSIAAGVTSLVIGTVVDASLTETIDSYESAARAGDTATYDRLRSSIAGDQNTAIAFYAIGGLLVAGGSGLLTWSLLEDDQIAIVPTPSGAVATYSW